MPIYEYRCSKCGFQKEFLQRLNEAPHISCPECGKRTLKKMVTAAGFQLKGTGWYATDFKNSGAKPKAKDKPAEASEASGKETGKETSKETSKETGKENAAKEAPSKEKSSKESSKSDSKSSAKASPASA